MIEELKQILTMVQNLPDKVLHVLAGFAIYKLVMWLSSVGAVTMLIKLAINKTYDAYTFSNSKPIVHEWKIDNRFITSDGTYRRFIELLDRLPGTRTVGSSAYIHDADIKFLTDAFREKLEREKAAKAESKV